MVLQRTQREGGGRYRATMHAPSAKQNDLELTQNQTLPLLRSYLCPVSLHRELFNFLNVILFVTLLSRPPNLSKSTKPGAPHTRTPTQASDLGSTSVPLTSSSRTIETSLPAS